jgi:hypothetical protein
MAVVSGGVVPKRVRADFCGCEVVVNMVFWVSLLAVTLFTIDNCDSGLRRGGNGWIM